MKKRKDSNKKVKVKIKNRLYIKEEVLRKNPKRQRPTFPIQTG
jgi:hypothetical protein